MKTLTILHEFLIEGRGKAILFELESNKSALPIRVGDEVFINSKAYIVSGIEMHNGNQAIGGLLIKESTQQV